MKHLMTVIAIVFFTTTGLSQTDSSTFKRHEIGVDATSLFGKVINLGFGYGAFNSPYTLIYRFRLSDKFNLRAKFGGDYINNDQFEGDSVVQAYNSLTILPTIGCEWNKHIHPKWSIYTGAELDYGYQNYRNKYSMTNSSSINNYSSKSHSFGAGTFLGIRFRFNEFVSLTTETRLGGQYEVTNLSSSIEYPSFPSSNQYTDYKTERFDFNVVAPIFVYLNISF